MNGHWGHEFLVFREDMERKNFFYLYFERHLYEDVDIAVFAWPSSKEMHSMSSCSVNLGTKRMQRQSLSPKQVSPESKTSFIFFVTANFFLNLHLRPYAVSYEMKYPRYCLLSVHGLAAFV